MTNKEAVNEYLKDRDSVVAFAANNCRKFVRNSNNVRTSYRAMDWHSRKTGNDYIIVMVKNPGEMVGFMYNAIVETDSGKVYYFFIEHDHRLSAHAFTSHFLSRFRERTGRTFASNKDTLAYYEASCVWSFNIYNNGNESVYASNNGIELCRKHDNGVLFINTFISPDLLKDNQMNAWKSSVDYLNELYANARMRHKDIVSAMDYMRSMTGFMRNECQSIYSQFSND